jgi:hypothetical protein
VQKAEGATLQAALGSDRLEEAADTFTPIEGGGLLWFNKSGHRDKRGKMRRGGVD